ncbi:MAG TPA: phage holin family protein [Streptosporangiaceae bacterium]|jgi:MFS family permease
MDAREHPLTGADLEDQSAADLVRHVSELVPRLVREEMALAKAELSEKGKRAGVGAGLFGGGGLVAFYGVGALVAAVVLGLAEALPGWAAALIVAVVLLAVAGVLALMAKKQASRATPPVPEQAISGVKQDVAAVKGSVRR